MLTIDAINDMLSLIGETAIDTTDPDYASHPLYADALGVLTKQSAKVQGRGWWFNERKTTLTPTAGAIAIGANILALNVLPTYGDTHDYTIRDGALFDLTDNTATITRTIDARVRELVAFEDLPETAAQYIAAAAGTRFLKTKDGDPGKVRGAEEDEAVAFVLFNTDHIRNSRVNLHTTQSMSPILARHWYTRYSQR